mmetsp:Transcript_26452/g.70736  ORF Transcript_26452/g.70736 Transcript_26452/m.70736 type:complete len:373 (+) Transcript_26452:2-1120(+)
MLMGSRAHRAKTYKEKAEKEKAAKERYGKWNALSNAQLRKAVVMLSDGLHEKSRKWGKQRLIEELSSMGVGPEDVQMILDEVGFEDKEPSSKKARQKGPRPRRPRGGEGGEMSRFTVEQLQEALFALGSGLNTFQWSKSRLIETLTMLQVDALDVSEILGAVRPEGGPKRRKGRRSGSPHSDYDGVESDDSFFPPEEWDWLQDAAGQPFRPPWEARGSVDFGSARFWGSDVNFNPSGSAKRERKRRLREERARTERQIEEQWLREYSDFPFPGAARQERSSSSASPAGAADGSVSPEDKAMWRALREGWSASALTRPQAMSLLGVTRAPSAETVRKARRKMVLHWHPDRNPDNPHASTALGLAMAACEALTS